LLQEPVVSGMVVSATGVAGIDNSGDLDRQARSLVELLEQQARAIGLKDPDIPAISMFVSDGVKNACAQKRKLKQIDQADDVVRRFVAFAEQIVALFPIGQKHTLFAATRITRWPKTPGTSVTTRKRSAMYTKPSPPRNMRLRSTRNH